MWMETPETVLDNALCAERTADSSLLVTDPAPAPVEEILLDKALITACNPVADPPPEEVAETFETALTKADTALERTLWACESAE